MSDSKIKRFDYFLCFCSLLIGILLNPFFTTGILSMTLIIVSPLLQLITFLLSCFLILLAGYFLIYPFFTNTLNTIYNSAVLKKRKLYLCLLFVLAGLLINPYFTIKIVKYKPVIDSFTWQLISFFFSILFIISATFFYLNQSAFIYPLWIKTLAFLTYIIFTIGSIELFFAFLISAKPHQVEAGAKLSDYILEDEALGYKPKSDTVVSYIKKAEGKIICDVKFSFDSLGRRITKSSNNVKKAKTLVFFGESYLFGEAINDDETLPSCVALQTPEHNVFNYGMICYATPQTYAKLASLSLRKEINSDSVTAVHLFNPISVRRTIGSRYSLSYREWYKVPYYESENDSLIKRGDIFSARPLFTFLSNMVNGLNTFRFWRVRLDFPIMSDYYFEHNAKMVLHSVELFKKQFPGNEFVVLIYPTNHSIYPDHRHTIERTIFYLNKFGIKYVDYSNLFSLDGDYVVRNEGHPSKKANMEVANQLVIDLNLK